MYRSQDIVQGNSSPGDVLQIDSLSAQIFMRQATLKIQGLQFIGRDEDFLKMSLQFFLLKI
jgi:hypothetical protein